MPESLQTWIAGLPVPPFLTQLLIVPLALGLGFGLAWTLRRWFAVTKMASRRHWSARLAQLVLIMAPALIAAALVGWLGYVEGELDAIALAPGELKFRDWALIQPMVVVTLF